MVTTKTGTCLESDPAQNQSGFNLSAHQWWVMIIKYREDMYAQIFFIKKTNYMS